MDEFTINSPQFNLDKFQIGKAYSISTKEYYNHFENNSKYNNHCILIKKGKLELTFAYYGKNKNKIKYITIDIDSVDSGSYTIKKLEEK